MLDEATPLVDRSREAAAAMTDAVDLNAGRRRQRGRRRGAVAVLLLLIAAGVAFWWMWRRRDDEYARLVSEPDRPDLTPTPAPEPPQPPAADEDTGPAHPPEVPQSEPQRTPMTAEAPSSAIPASAMPPTMVEEVRSEFEAPATPEAVSAPPVREAQPPAAESSSPSAEADLTEAADLTEVADSTEVADLVEVAETAVEAPTTPEAPAFTMPQHSATELTAEEQDTETSTVSDEVSDEVPPAAVIEEVVAEQDAATEQAVEAPVVDEDESTASAPIAEESLGTDSSFGSEIEDAEPVEATSEPDVTPEWGFTRPSVAADTQSTAEALEDAVDEVATTSERVDEVPAAVTAPIDELENLLDSAGQEAQPDEEITEQTEAIAPTDAFRTTATAERLDEVLLAAEEKAPVVDVQSSDDIADDIESASESEAESLMASEESESAEIVAEDVDEAEDDEAAEDEASESTPAWPSTVATEEERTPLTASDAPAPPPPPSEPERNARPSQPARSEPPSNPSGAPFRTSGDQLPAGRSWPTLPR